MSIDSLQYYWFYDYLIKFLDFMSIIKKKKNEMTLVCLCIIYGYDDYVYLNKISVFKKAK